MSLGPDVLSYQTQFLFAMYSTNLKGLEAVGYGHIVSVITSLLAEGWLVLGQKLALQSLNGIRTIIVREFSG